MNKLMPLIACLFVLSGCTASAGFQGSQDAPNPDMMAPDPPPPEPSRATFDDANESPDDVRIKGQIVSTTLESPLKFYMVYLGEKLYLTPGPDYLIAFKQEQSPSAKTDEDGYFTFSEVEPGQYAIIVWAPHNSYVIPDASGEKELVVRIQEGQRLDIGTIEIAWP